MADAPLAPLLTPEETQINDIGRVASAADPDDVLEIRVRVLQMLCRKIAALRAALAERDTRIANLKWDMDNIAAQLGLTSREDVPTQIMRTLDGVGQAARRSAFQAGFLAVCVAKADLTTDEGVRRTWTYDGLAARDLEPEAYAAWVDALRASPDGTKERQ